MNAGNLAFEYALDITTSDSQPIQTHYLRDAIDVYIKIVEKAPATIADSEYKTEGWVHAGKLADILGVTEEGVVHGVLLPNGKTADATGYEKVEEAYAVIALHMQESADNNYQNLTENFDIMLWAKQYTEEFDSETDQYDKNAQYETKDNVDRVPDSGSTEPPVVTPEQVTVAVTVYDDGVELYKESFTVDVGTEIDLTGKFTAPENHNVDKYLKFTAASDMTEYVVNYTNIPADAASAEITVGYNIPDLTGVTLKLMNGKTVVDSKTTDAVTGSVTFKVENLASVETINYTVVAEKEGIDSFNKTGSAAVEVTYNVEDNKYEATVTATTPIETGYTRTIMNEQFDNVTMDADNQHATTASGEFFVTKIASETEQKFTTETVTIGGVKHSVLRTYGNQNDENNGISTTLTLTAGHQYKFEVHVATVEIDGPDDTDLINDDKYAVDWWWGYIYHDTKNRYSDFELALKNPGDAHDVTPIANADYPDNGTGAPEGE